VARDIIQFVWASSERLAFVIDTEGDENWHVWGVDRAGGPPRNLTPLERVQARLLSDLKAFDDVILVSLNDRDARLHDAWRINVATGERSLAVIKPGLRLRMACGLFRPCQSGGGRGADNHQSHRPRSRAGAVAHDSDVRHPRRHHPLWTAMRSQTRILYSLLPRIASGHVSSVSIRLKRDCSRSSTSASPDASTGSPRAREMNVSGPWRLIAIAIAGRPGSSMRTPAP
jgi:hypothetical protein